MGIPKINLRSMMVLGLCIVSAWGVYDYLHFSADENSTDLGVTRSERPRQVSEAMEIAHLNKREQTSVVNSDFFKPRVWFTPPPVKKIRPAPTSPAPVIVELPPPNPGPPPFPYKFMGSFDNLNGNMIVYLTMGNKFYTLKLGDTLDGTYRIDSFKDNLLLVTYLPLNVVQTIPVGEK